ncbi:MAG: hypothetical protein AVDCRST_MAG66-1705, partial [uncultured Pseudonocardia sp.]
ERPQPVVRRGARRRPRRVRGRQVPGPGGVPRRRPGVPARAGARGGPRRARRSARRDRDRGAARRPRHPDRRLRRGRRPARRLRRRDGAGPAARHPHVLRLLRPVGPPGRAPPRGAQPGPDRPVRGRGSRCGRRTAVAPGCDPRAAGRRTGGRRRGRPRRPRRRPRSPSRRPDAHPDATTRTDPRRIEVPPV